MLDERSKGLWAKVCETVTRLGSPRAAQTHRFIRVERPFPRILDLHGITIADAFVTTRDFIETCPHREILIITGRSGDINREFVRWCENWPRIKTVTPENGGGAFRIRLS